MHIRFEWIMASEPTRLQWKSDIHLKMFWRWCSSVKVVGVATCQSRQRTEGSWQTHPWWLCWSAKLEQQWYSLQEVVTCRYIETQLIKFNRYDEKFVVRTGVGCQKHPLIESGLHHNTKPTIECTPQLVAYATIKNYFIAIVFCWFETQLYNRIS